MAEGNDKVSSCNDTITNEETLLRLVWSEDVDNEGCVATSAINKTDIEGPERGFSVDREQIAKPEVIQALADFQKSKGCQVEPLISRLLCSAVRDIEFEGETVFDIYSLPITNAKAPLLNNDAHSEVRSLKKRNNRNKLNELRLKLIKIMESPISIDNCFSKKAS